MFVYHGYIITQKPPIPYKGKVRVVLFLNQNRRNILRSIAVYVPSSRQTSAGNIHNLKTISFDGESRANFDSASNWSTVVYHNIRIVLKRHSVRTCLTSIIKLDTGIFIFY